MPVDPVELSCELIRRPSVTPADAGAMDIVERELARPVVPRTGDDWATLALDVRDRLTVSSPRHLTA